jgi:NADP-dependent 3-hydroxy acid dehydrogenase YdfG
MGLAENVTLAGKTALVTGGGTGIGRAIAKALAEFGCRVAIAGRRRDCLEQAASDSPRDAQLIYHSVDVADRQSVGALVQWATDALGSIDILVNSAGVNIKNRRMAEMTPAQWDQVMAINATGAYNCIAAVLPQMRQRQDGLIVNISSISGKRAGELGGVAYCASKFAMTALGTAVGLEEACHGIRVTNIFPGEVDTPILQHRPQPVSAEHRATMLLPDDVAAMVTAIACLPPRAHVPELVIKPTRQAYA